MSAETPTTRTPRERWGTCCPGDPECEHSFMDEWELDRWLDTPIPDVVAEGLEW